MESLSAKPTLLERLSFSICKRFLKAIKKGELTLSLPNGDQLKYGNPHSGRNADIQIHSYSLFWRIVKDGNIGLGEGFIENNWSSSDLPNLIAFFLDNLELNSERKLNLILPVRLINKIWHRRRANSIKGAKANIHAHYDLSNDFFSKLLDKTMTYSSAYFTTPEEPLEVAQRNKLRLIADKALINSSDHVLEIGSGWGSFAINTAKERGCKVTTLTISEEQFRYVKSRIKEEGLEGQVEVVLKDYRLVEGKFDKIVSIEMMEAIGKEYLGKFIECCEKLLRPDGIAVLQVITMIDYWYEEYCKRCDWIQKYIFPGSHLPSLTHLSKEISNNSKLIIEGLENIAPHYAKTLATWRNTLHQIKSDLPKMGFDERFFRIFDYYLASCEAEFGSRWLNVLQIVLTRPNNQRLLDNDNKRLNVSKLSVAA